MKAAQIARAIELRKAGWPIDCIARRLHKGHVAISKCLKAAGFSVANGGPRYLGVATAPDIVTKTCRGPCGAANLPLSEFYKNRTCRDGHHHTCSMCMRAYQKVEYGKRVQERVEHRKAPVRNGHRVTHVVPEPIETDPQEPMSDPEFVWIEPLKFSDGRRIDEPKPRRWAI